MRWIRSVVVGIGVCAGVSFGVCAGVSYRFEGNDRRIAGNHTVKRTNHEVIAAGCSQINDDRRPRRSGDGFVTLPAKRPKIDGVATAAVSASGRTPIDRNRACRGIGD